MAGVDNAGQVFVRDRLEQSMGCKLNIDDETLSHLLKMAAIASSSDLLDLVGEFCPDISDVAQAQLAAGLIEFGPTPPPSPRLQLGTPRSVSTTVPRGTQAAARAAFLPDVHWEDEQLAHLVAGARRLAASEFEEDCISRISTDPRQHLAVLVEREGGGRAVLGFVVYSLRPLHLCVLQLAVPPGFRGRGFGRHLLECLTQHAQSFPELEAVTLRAAAPSAGFFRRCGFRRQGGSSQPTGTEEQLLLELPTEGRAAAPPGQAASPAPSAPPAAAPRARLLSGIFEALDGDADGQLSCSEMRRFATETGFAGTDEEWAAEFEQLCGEAGTRTGVSLEHFQRLVDDTTEAGCFCSDDELRQMLERLPDGRHGRPALVRRAFAALDQPSGDGLLDVREMQLLAECTGFTGNEAQWAEEYLELCADVGAEPGVGIGLPLFARMVNDHSERGCYCTDEQLRKLAQLRGSRAVGTLSAAAAPGGGKVCGAAVAAAARATAGAVVAGLPLATEAAAPPLPSSPTVIPPERAQLIRRVFEGCDKNGDGVLDAREMLQFAVLTGFAGDEAEWQEEFRNLCLERRGPGSEAIGGTAVVDVELFAQLVEDGSERGCYCTDDDLRLILSHLQALAAAAGLAPEEPQIPGGRLQEPESPEDAASRLRKEMGSGLKICILGSTSFSDTSSEGLAESLGKQISEWAACGAVLVTGGNSGVQEVFTRSCVPNSRLFHLQLPGGQSGMPRGRDVHAGRDAQEKKTILGLVGDVYITVEGGPGVAHEAGFAVKCGVPVIPLRRSGGASEGMFDFPVMALQKPVYATPAEWELLGRRDVSVERSAAAVAAILDRIAQKGGRSGTAPSPAAASGPAAAATAALPPGAVGPGLAALPFRRRSRTDLLRAVFRLCDLDRDGRLSCQEMRYFATQTGFDGSEEDWASEYAALCRHGKVDPSSGVSVPAFEDMVDDTEDGGCYCADDELRAVRARLESAAVGRGAGAAVSSSAPSSLSVPLAVSTLPAPSAPSVPSPPRRAVGSAADSARAADLTLPPGTSKRRALTEKLFALCDADGDGLLCAAEMLHYAQRTGFTGSTEEWGQEYELLCAEHGADARRGLSLEVFSMIVDDTSDNGCYCSEEGLQEVVRLLVAGRATRPSPPPPQPAHAQPEASTNCLPAPAAAAPTTNGRGPAPAANSAVPVPTDLHRTKLLREVFAACDLNGDGRLDEAELLRFAEATGFDQSAEVWQEEFRAVCEEHGTSPTNGLSITGFASFINDTSDSGCFCSDEELQDILATWVAGRGTHVLVADAGAGDSTGSGSRPTAEQEEHAGNESRGPGKSTRGAFVAEVFAECDGNGDGLLDWMEMEVFARLSGFDGDQNEWAEEYQLLCSQLGVDPRSGVGPAQFRKLVDDPGECYIADADLQTMIARLRRRPARTAAPPQPAGLAAETAPPPYRRAPQPQPAAPECNLMPTEPPHRELGGPTVPPSRAGQTAVAKQLPRGRADGATALEDDELRLAGTSFPQQPRGRSPAGLEQQQQRRPLRSVVQDRAALIHDVFKACDVDGDGFLSLHEMERLAMELGFEGSADDWADEFSLLCEEGGADPRRGLDVSVLTSVVDDSSERGIFCKDEELRALPPRIRTRVANEAAGSPLAAALPAARPSSMPAPAPGPCREASAAKASNRQPRRQALLDDAERPVLVKSLFRTCDRDGDGFLSMKELGRFARRTGFQGDEQQWHEEYALLCAEQGGDATTGLTFEMFKRLVDDDSGDGCYCGDAELRAMLVDWAASPGQEPPHPRSREQAGRLLERRR